MLWRPSKLGGAWLIEPQPVEDDRGFFARTWCRREFERHGLEASVAQCSVAFNARKGTLRGMHYQAMPHAEAKLVRCTTGGVYDVIIDLRPKSPTFRQWEGFTLSARNHLTIYVPKGFAHGYLTLEDQSEVSYQMSDFYEPSAGRGVRWNDPAFGIEWPGEVRVIHQRDANYSDFVVAREP